MDAIKGFFLWPFISLYYYSKFTIGSLIALIPTIIYLIRYGIHSLDSFVDLFNYLKHFPFGLSIFSGIVTFYAPYTGKYTMHCLACKRETSIYYINDRAILNAYSLLLSLYRINIW